jgi:hypothetical protein
LQASFCPFADDGALADGSAVETALRPLVSHYRNWIESQRSSILTLQGARHETADELLRLAGIAADRIAQGISVLAKDADALDAFRVANRTVGRALRKRLGIEAPRWHALESPARPLPPGFGLLHELQRELESPTLCGPALKFRACTPGIPGVSTKSC